MSTEVFGNLAGGRTKAAIWESLFIAGVEVDFEKAAGVPGLSLLVSGLCATGTGLTNKAVHDFNTLSNIDAYDSVRFELGYRLNPPVSGASERAGAAPQAGSYKLGGFYDSGRFEDRRGRASKRGNAEFYLILEQELWHPAGLRLNLNY